MISNISSQVSSYDTLSATSSTEESSTDQEIIESILANYDADSLSQEDAKAIVTALQNAGIEPSSELESALDEAGFDAQEIGTLAGVGGPKGGGGMPPPPPSTEDVDTLADILAELLEAEEDEESTLSSTNAYSSSSDSTSFEDVLDYTSRIIQLNDTAKDEVMELFESYKSVDGEDTDVSSTEINNALKSSLKDILSDSSNYKSVSFYA